MGPGAGDKGIGRVGAVGVEEKIYGCDSLLIKVIHSSKVNFESESEAAATRPRSGGPLADGGGPPAGGAAGAPLGGAGSAEKEDGSAEKEDGPGRARDGVGREASSFGAGAKHLEAGWPISWQR